MIDPRNETALIPYSPTLPAEQEIIEGQVSVFPVQQRPSLPSLIEAWHKSKKSARTQNAYAQIMQDFQQFVQASPDHQIDLLESPWQAIEQAVRAFLPDSKVSGRVVSVSTRNQRVAALRSFYEYLLIHDYINKNPLRTIQAEKGDHPHKARRIAPEVVKKGITSINTQTLVGKRDKAMLALLVTTGQRVSEVTGLTWSRVYPTADGLVARFLCKGEKVLEKLLEQGTCQLLEDYRLGLVDHLQRRGLQIEPTMPVFINLSHHASKKEESEEKKTHPLRLSTETVSTITQKYLLESRVHATRHTYAVRAYKNGATYTQIMRDMGHSSLQITTTYMEEQLLERRDYAAEMEKDFGIGE